MIQAVTFDVGGTLIEPFPSVGAVYAGVAREFGFDCPPEVITRQFGEAWLARSGFGYSRPEWLEVVERSFDGLARVSPGLFDRIYERFRDASAWRLFDDVLPALEALRRRGLRLAVVSNWDDRLEPLLGTLGLHAHFEHVTVSARLGRHKPDAEVFRHTLRALGLPAADVLHVGDSLREDFGGATAAGLRAVRLRRAGRDLPCDIGHLGELEDRAAAPWTNPFAPISSRERMVEN